MGSGDSRGLSVALLRMRRYGGMRKGKGWDLDVSNAAPFQDGITDKALDVYSYISACRDPVGVIRLPLQQGDMKGGSQDICFDDVSLPKAPGHRSKVVKGQRAFCKSLGRNI